MTECLRGSGSYKRSLLEEIRDNFGKRRFKFRDVADYSSFPVRCFTGLRMMDGLSGFRSDHRIGIVFRPRFSAL